jgi:hypothetical protein
MHTREFDSIQKLNGVKHEVSNFGGVTKIEVTTPDMIKTEVGESKCSPKENFNRRLGNSIALGRALDKLGYNDL